MALNLLSTGRIGQAHLDTATRHQNQIGWFGLLTGRISRYWTDAQHAYYVRQKIDKLPRRWASALIKQFFLVAWDLWKDRNDIKHSSPTAAERREMARLDEEIEEIRQAGTSGVTGRDATLLALSTDRQRRMSVEQKRRWVHRAEKIRTAHVDHPVVTTISEHNTLITDWASISSVTDSASGSNRS